MSSSSRKQRQNEAAVSQTRVSRPQVHFNKAYHTLDNKIIALCSCVCSHLHIQPYRLNNTFHFSARFQVKKTPSKMRTYRKTVLDLKCCGRYLQCSAGGGHAATLQSTLRLADSRNFTNTYRRPGRRDTNDVSEPTAGPLASPPALTFRTVRSGDAPACI